jgi:isoamylase/glycogen operon protein
MSEKQRYPVFGGAPTPLGASKTEEGVNFALFSQHANAISLCLFALGAEAPFLEVSLDEPLHRTGWVRHARITHLPPAFDYAYRIDGALLLDPYATHLDTPLKWGDPDLLPYQRGPRGRVVLESSFDWEGDRFPRIPLHDLILYEMHVRGFTIDPSSNCAHPGSFLGVVEKIPHLRTLGVNAVELLPIHEFNECDGGNYWGYSTVNFFSPMHRYASSSACEDAVRSFKTMVKELHRAGIEVILDVVFNHTSEGGKQGPVHSFKGIDALSYYIFDEQGEYANFSGCGNTFKCQGAAPFKLILDALRYWVSEMHVDGFRFDLASILTRDERGEPLASPPLIQAISKDPILADVKLIAEPWDAGGLYQVGRFPTWGRWSEWNDQYRDTVRRFIKGTDGQAGAFATRLCGSQDLYGQEGTPCSSVNFITAHDGYTLRDLVSYQEKHNLDNGEDNRDGSNHNESWNCGVEGETKNRSILRLRERQMKNFHTALMLSLGIPMILMGDEYGHTRKGNNNPWCQDNARNWFLWEELDKQPSFFRFFSKMIRFRATHALLRQNAFLSNEQVEWHGAEPHTPNWEADSRLVALTLHGEAHEPPLYICFNAHYEGLSLLLPAPPRGKKWRRIVDTALPSPLDFSDDPWQHPLKATYKMAAHSALIAEAR